MCTANWKAEEDRIAKLKANQNGVENIITISRFLIMHIKRSSLIHVNPSRFLVIWFSIFSSPVFPELFGRLWRRELLPYQIWNICNATEGGLRRFLISFDSVLLEGTFERIYSSHSGIPQSVLISAWKYQCILNHIKAGQISQSETGASNRF